MNKLHQKNIKIVQAEWIFFVYILGLILFTKFGPKPKTFELKHALNFSKL